MTTGWTAVTSTHCASSSRNANIVSPITTANGSRPQRAAAQQLDWLAGQEAELAESAQRDRVDFR